MKLHDHTQDWEVRETCDPACVIISGSLEPENSVGRHRRK